MDWLLIVVPIPTIVCGWLVYKILIGSKCAHCGKRSWDVYKGYHPDCWYELYGKGHNIWEIDAISRSQGRGNIL